MRDEEEESDALPIYKINPVVTFVRQTIISHVK